MSDYPVFPKDFLFGSAAASYQIEGAWNEDGKGESIWDRFSHTPGKIKNGDTGDVACDHYHRYKEDISIMKELELESYRFSISWPRILPDGKGQVNSKGLDFYSRLVDNLLDNNIIPFITLYHWDLPQALQDKGGFMKRDCAKYFAEYVEVVAKHLGDRVKNWITINEIWINVMVGYLIAYHAPGKFRPWKAVNVLHNEMLGHGFAARVLKSLFPDSNVGVTLDLSPIYPLTHSEKDKKAVNIVDQFKNRITLDPILKGEYPPELLRKLSIFGPKIKPGDMEIINTPIDFLGINNYSRDFAYYRRWIPIFHAWMVSETMPDKEFVKDGIQYTKMGNQVFPQGIYEVLTRIKNEYGNIPTYITENGASFTDVLVNGEVHDNLRIDYLQAYIKKVYQALQEGVDVRGYFLWSFIDNFEWAEGYFQRFGIVYCDHKTQDRFIKDSGKWYAGLIKSKK